MSLHDGAGKKRAANEFRRQRILCLLFGKKQHVPYIDLIIHGLLYYIGVHELPDR